MWRIRATWKNNVGSTVTWNAGEWADFTSFLMAVSPNPQETYNDLLFIGTRASNVQNSVDATDPTVGWITQFDVPNDQVKDEVVNYYNNIIKPKYANIGTVTVVAEQI